MTATALVEQQPTEPARVLAKHERELLAGHIAEIRRLGKQAISSVIEIGGRLHACKFLVGHGNWADWLKTEFDWSERTARYFISVYDLAKSKSANFAELGLPLSAIYLLAAPSTPPDAVDEVTERAERGEVVKFDDVREVIEEHKDRANGKPRPDAEALDARAGESGWSLNRDHNGKYSLYRPHNDPNLCDGDPWFYEIKNIRLRDVAEQLDDIERSPDPANFKLPDDEPTPGDEPTIDKVAISTSCTCSIRRRWTGLRSLRARLVAGSLSAICATN